MDVKDSGRATRAIRSRVFATPEDRLCQSAAGLRRLLFIKRHRRVYNHMCDQYYGMRGTPGGGLYVLDDPFGESPTVRDVLAGSRSSERPARRASGSGAARPPAIRFDGVGNLTARTTEGGSFLSPDLSYDGKQILFAYVECRGDRIHLHHTDPSRGHWDPGRCYHVFKVNVDGIGPGAADRRHLERFRPLLAAQRPDRLHLRAARRLPALRPRLPHLHALRHGRRRQRHQLPELPRDQRVEPQRDQRRADPLHPLGLRGPFRLHGPPAVDHHAGRPRLAGGARQLRPAQRPARHGARLPRDPRLAEIRGHGGAAPRPGVRLAGADRTRTCPTTTRMGPVRRITPEVGFPESQGGTNAYGMAWPLSEDYYLCVYDARNEHRHRAGPETYGIYLVDTFGNKELLYRDRQDRLHEPDSAAAKARAAGDDWRCPRPQIAARGPGASGRSRARRPWRWSTSTTALTPWPEGTKIKPLRVLQLLPMSVPSGRPPFETGKRIAMAGDSVVPVRYVLGTRARRGRRQRQLHRAGQRGALLPGARRQRAGRAVDAVGDVPARGRKADLRGLPRAQGSHAADGARPRRWRCAARRRGSRPTSTAPTRSATRAWSSRCSTATASKLPRKTENARQGAEPRPRADQAQLVRLVQQPDRQVRASPTTATTSAPRRASSAPGRRSSTRCSRRATTT